MKITEIAFTAYPVSDIARAKEFYEGLLGLPKGEFDHELPGMPGKYWVEYQIGDGTFAISNMWEPSGQGGPNVAFEVEDFDAAVAKLKEAGVQFISECIETSVCKFALIKDPDGNDVTIHKRHPDQG